MATSNLIFIVNADSWR